MYDIRKLNIWKKSSSDDVFRYREKILEIDVSESKEACMNNGYQEVFAEMSTFVPSENFMEIKRRRGGKLRFPMYISEKLMVTSLEALDLSARSINALHRAGFQTIGELVDKIEGAEDLMRIRNCGSKSIDEIMEKLFCYQYNQLDASQKERYVHKVLQLNAN